jgi:hypothetical protein
MIVLDTPSTIDRLGLPAANGSLSAAFRARLRDARTAYARSISPTGTSISTDNPSLVLVVQAGRRIGRRTPLRDLSADGADAAVVDAPANQHDDDCACHGVASRITDYCKNGLFLLLRDDVVIRIGPYGTRTQRGAAQEEWQVLMRQALLMARMDPTYGVEFAVADRYSATLTVARGSADDRQILTTCSLIAWRPTPPAPATEIKWSPCARRERV